MVQPGSAKDLHELQDHVLPFTAGLRLHPRNNRTVAFFNELAVNLD